MTGVREKETIITIMVGLLVLYAVFSLHWLWMAAVIVGLAGILSDTLTRVMHRTWFWIAEKLGYVMARLIFGALFVTILLPVAVLAKIFRSDFMLLKRNYPSYFVERPHRYQRKDLENPW